MKLPNRWIRIISFVATVIYLFMDKFSCNLWDYPVVKGLHFCYCKGFGACFVLPYWISLIFMSVFLWLLFSVRKLYHSLMLLYYIVVMGYVFYNLEWLYVEQMEATYLIPVVLMLLGFCFYFIGFWKSCRVRKIGEIKVDEQAVNRSFADK